MFFCAIVGQVPNEQLLGVAGAHDPVSAHVFLLREPLRPRHWWSSASWGRGSTTRCRSALTASSLVAVRLAALGEGSSLLALSSPWGWLSCSRSCRWLCSCSRACALLGHGRPGARLVGDWRRRRRLFDLGLRCRSCLRLWLLGRLPNLNRLLGHVGSRCLLEGGDGLGVRLPFPDSVLDLHDLLLHRPVEPARVVRPIQVLARRVARLLEGQLRLWCHGLCNLCLLGDQLCLDLSGLNFG